MNYSFQIEKRLIVLMTLAFLFAFLGCTEPFQGTVGDFENVLVVNTVITNETKRQEVQLTRSYRFEEDGPQPEENAQVSISTDDGEDFPFEEVDSGKYESLKPFAAQMEKAYHLNIITQDGRSYSSSKMYLPTETTSIDQLYAERTVNDNGDEGMGIFVDTFDASRESNYYRYDFMETYKIIAPFWSPEDVVFVIQLSTGPEFDVILREREERVCYDSERAKTINVINTLNLSEDRLSRYRIRFIDRDNYILSHRYSILVKQYVQSPEAYSYYEILKGLSQSSTDIFSEDQPGFLAGNIVSLEDPNENVAGFFEVATVAEKRIFFNYKDFFPGEELPPYILNCAPSISSGDNLANAIKNETQVFYDINGGIRTVSRACGDCTALGSNKVPDFWIE
jgi:Domain of unknown function (DUF4249)